MNIEVIEFELTCPRHGAHRTIVPARSPWPKRCVHCLRLLADRSEVRRFSMPLEGPLPADIATESWIG